ncbi:hypothetical protein LIER_10477 [Lithospermum erythrorhizon]|uniref:Uncharacterized protein n=1 Tax=Lithospermum erythrorhizon TaxID=34254 RepID=A0AAV3PJE0_LITER
MLRAEVLGAMKVQSPTRLRNYFAHNQLRRVAEEFEHEKSSLGEEMRRIREERDSIFAEKENVTQKYNDLLRSQDELISNHTATEGKLAYELETTKAYSQKIASDLEKSKDELARVQSRLEGYMVEKDDLHSRLSMAENSAATALKILRSTLKDYVVELFDDLPDDEDEDLGTDDDEDGDEDNDGGDDDDE